MNGYRVIAPSLLRRTDRWLVFVGTMIAQGVPIHRIKRFISHDGDFFPDGKAAHRAATATLRDQGREPKYLDVPEGDPYNYCWHWTWYELMHAIATQSDEAVASLIIIDDWMMMIGYERICAHVEAASSKSDKFHGIQYVHDPIGCRRPPKTNLTPVEDCPDLQYEFVGGTDTAFLVAPSGARILLDFADAHPKCPPAKLFYLFANEVDQRGWYSTVKRCACTRPSGIIDDAQDRRAFNNP